MKRIGAAIVSFIRTTDRWLLLFWITASVLQLIFLVGITVTGYAEWSTVIVQVIANAIGIVCALIIAIFDYNVLLRLWKLYVPACFLLMLLTFVWGSTRGDNQNWLILSLGRFRVSLQPSEFLKISFITTLALHVKKTRDHFNEPRNILLFCLHGGVHIFLVQLQGDTGSALIFLSIFLVVAFAAGISWRYIVPAMVLGAISVPILWFRFLSPDQKMRIMTLFNPEISKDYAYQQARGILALGVGGLRGTGVLTGKHVYVPEIYNDFIFSFIGEACGFIGSLGVLLLLAAIAFKILYNSKLALDDTGRFICIGIFAMIFSQTFINLGMCLNLLPVIGVTLPLLSQGGSSALSLYLGLGLVLSVYGHSKTTLFYQK